MSRAFREQYDAIVVGGRIAGSVTAALLGEAGLSVLLVERVRFPRSTISTHFFRGAGLVSVLDRLSVLDEVLALGPPPLRREWAHGFGSPGPVEEPPQDSGDAGFGLSVRREPLDAILLERAQRCDCVDIAQPAAVRGLIVHGDRVAGAHIDHLGGSLEVGGRVVVGADGRHSTVARLVEPSIDRAVEPMRTLYYRYVSGWRGPRRGTARRAGVFPERGRDGVRLPVRRRAHVRRHQRPEGRLRGVPRVARR